MLTSIFIVAALILGGLAVHRATSAFGNSWVLQEPERIAVVVSILTPAFFTTALFLLAGWLVHAPMQSGSPTSRRLSTVAILAALYGPLYWAMSSSLWHLFLVLPGFIASFFTKPLDSDVAFVAAGAASTVLLLYSLREVRDRLRYGRLAAPAIALVISLPTSYAAYALMRA